MNNVNNAVLNEVIGIINDGLNNISNNYTSYKKNYISGRMAAYCPRYNYLNSRIETNESLNALPVITAEFGKVYETFLLKSLKENNKLAGYDLTLNDELFPINNLSYFGVIDAVLNTNNGDYHLVDIKTKDRIKDIKKSKDEYKEVELDKPELQDIAQVSFYASLTGLECSLVYLSRKVMEDYGSIAYKIFPIDVNRKNTLHMAFFSTYCIKNNILPNIPKNFKKSVNCKYCTFYNYCWKEEPINFNYNKLTMKAYEETEILADEYLANIDYYKNRFLNLMINDQLQGKYFRSLESRL